MNEQKPQSTHFGYENVDVAEKAGRVRGVFDSVAPKYDLMNDLMSAGLHRLWKRFALSRTGLRQGDAALDVAGGTGDLSAGMSEQVGPSGIVCLTDINASMLEHGRRRLLNRGIVGNLHTVQANAEQLPFTQRGFNCVTCGFGLRNVTDKQRALESMRSVIKPGGRVLILEFSKPVLGFVEPIYEAYSFKILPALGEMVANDAASYRYLAESIRMHPDQETLVDMMTSAGLEDAQYYNLSGGIVALHIGYRY